MQISQDAELTGSPLQSDKPIASLSFSTIYVSYAYPAGASVKPINDVVVIPVD